MYLKHASSNDLVEVMDMASVIDPCQDKVVGRFHRGEEMQDPEDFAKTDLIFPSGEGLPACWTDPDYKSR